MNCVAFLGQEPAQSLALTGPQPAPAAPAHVLLRPPTTSARSGSAPPAQHESPPTGRRTAPDGTRTQGPADRTAARHHVHRAGPNADPAGPRPLLPRPRVSDQPTRWGGSSCVLPQAHRHLSFHWGVSDPVLVSDPPRACTRACAHAQRPPRGQPRSDSHHAPSHTTPPPHSGLGRTFRCWVLPSSTLSSLQALSTQPRAAQAGSPPGRPFPHTASHTRTHPLARGHSPTEGPAPGLALLASIIPVDSEPPPQTSSPRVPQFPGA